MSVSVVCCTHNKLLFLKDFLASFLENSRPDTELVVCAQGCTDGTNRWLSQYQFNSIIRANHIKFVIETDNIGLSRYDELVQTYTAGDIIIDADEDVLLFKGYEEVLSDVLTDGRFGWVGIPAKNTELLKFPGGRQWNVNGYRVVEAAVGGHLAATSKKVWERVGGFGRGRTIFDPEDARYQRECIEAGYLTGVAIGEIGVGITERVECEHHNSWEWAIKYGTVEQKMENNRQAMLAEFWTEDQYRSSLQEYLEIAGQ